MKFRDLSLFPQIVLLSVAVIAQTRPGGGGGGAPGGSNNGGRTTGGTTSTPRNNPPQLPSINSPLDLYTPLFLSGKVVVDDGTPLTEAALIQSICRGRVRNEGYTDSRGTFSLDLSSTPDTIGTAEESASPMPRSTSTGRPTRNLRDCDLQAVLPGFTSRVIELSSKMNEFGNADVGTIVLHRMGAVEGFTISATSAAAPSKAQKQYEKGRKQEEKGKFEAAAAEFAKAVEIYPKYAVAWYELGKVELQQKQVAQAKESFQRAITADEKFIRPYAELAQLALNEKQWNDVLDLTGRVVQLNPVSFPQYWFFNGLANYYLRNFDAAEKSVTQALSLDTQHKMPGAEYLLGLILIQKQDYKGALAHIRSYVQMAPGAPDVPQAQKQIAELERLSSLERAAAPAVSQNK